MTNFSLLWDTEVKAQALACVKNEIVSILMQPKEYVLTEEEKLKIEEWNKQYKDLYAHYYISQMCWQIGHDLDDGRELSAKAAIIRVYNCISSESYWTNVFDNNQDSEEAKNLLILKNGLKRLLDTN